MSDSKTKKFEKAYEQRKKVEDSNPCLKEQEMSYKCLDKNNYDYDKCTYYFENYKQCKKFWNAIRLDRVAKGILPYIPLPEERAEIKARHFTKKTVI